MDSMANNTLQHLVVYEDIPAVVLTNRYALTYFKHWIPYPTSDQWNKRCSRIILRTLVLS